MSLRRGACRTVPEVNVRHTESSGAACQMIKMHPTLTCAIPVTASASTRHASHVVPIEASADCSSMADASLLFECISSMLAAWSNPVWSVALCMPLHSPFSMVHAARS